MSAILRRSAFRKKLLASAIVSALVAGYGPHVFGQSAENASAGTSTPIEEILIWGSDAGQRSGITHPASVLTPADLASINIATTEDVVKYEPSLVIRRRFIGDSNGTIGMRGANMFQTSRSMVFADGVPLHYLLQSRWNGSPRWSMVSASEIAQVEVLYGPFSAEYSGNAMGGVVLIESAIPQQREFHFDSSYFSQAFDAYGFNDTLTGYKSFFSVGDKIGDTSLYFSYNRLDNDSQPQTFYFGANNSSPAATDVTGGVVGNDQFGNSQLWFGDTGVVDTQTRNYKIKIGQDIGDWAGLLNIAYEDRASDNTPNAYMRDGSGNPVWSGNVRQNESGISIPAARLGVGEQERDSLSLGLRVRGPLTNSIDLESNLNQFAIVRDQSRDSLRNPADPAYTPAGQVTDFGDTGWQSAEVKLTFSELGVDNLSLVSGLRHDAYELNIDVYDSSNYQAGSKNQLSSRSGGETSISAAFAELSWLPTQQWALTLGGRYETFDSKGGYYTTQVAGNVQPVSVPGQSRNAFSPKFTAAYQPTDRWTLSYAAARAYRFPIVEELFSQYQAYNTVNQANPALKPEDGLHHNLGIEYGINGGYVRVNVFQESIKDVIEAQAETLPGGVSVRTFIPIDQVDTLGTEFIVNATGLGLDALDVRFNATYTDNEIARNRVDTSIEGNVYPRLPAWRGNLLATYHVSDDWNIGLNYQYADTSFGRNDNRDTEQNVYGAQDGYSRIGIKTDYRFGNGFTLGAGIDNISNDVDFVAHPWPGRTVYLNVAYDWQ
ncbi:MAG: TonB-dependent receptor [Pseudohongiella sp.]